LQWVVERLRRGFSQLAHTRRGGGSAFTYRRDR
jgi:hypothetical protein